MAKTSISESVKEVKARIAAKAKKKNSNLHGCCDIEYDGDKTGEIRSLRVEIADNGFIVEANYNERLVVTTPEEAGEAITEFLK